MNCKFEKFNIVADIVYFTANVKVFGIKELNITATEIRFLKAASTVEFKQHPKSILKTKALDGNSYGKPGNDGNEGPAGKDGTRVTLNADAIYTTSKVLISTEGTSTPL